MQEKLKPAGVQTLSVVNTPLDRARLYFKYRPTPIILAADPEASTHRLFGVPAFEVGEESDWPRRVTSEEFGAVRVNPTGELPAALHPMEANDELNRRDGFQMTEVDQQILAAHATQATGHFFIDREGTIRWTYIEASNGVAGLTVFPTGTAILPAGGPPSPRPRRTPFSPAPGPPASACRPSIARAPSPSTSTAASSPCWWASSGGSTDPSAAASSCSWTRCSRSSSPPAWRPSASSTPPSTAPGSTSSTARRACPWPPTPRPAPTPPTGCRR